MRTGIRRKFLLWSLFASLFGLSGCNQVTLNRVAVLPHVAFMGDSITAFWSAPGDNFGVSKNTTKQMLARFPAEILGHGYRVVVILGGINDIVDHQTTPVILANIAEMAQIARQAGIDVVLCELTPNYQHQLLHDPEVRELNRSIVQLASDRKYALVDYYDPMIGHPEYFKDGLHPNAEGYAVMDHAVIPVVVGLLGTQP